MEKKIKILFILPSLKAGGAERVVSFIAQNLDTTRFTPSLLIVGFEKDVAFSIHDIETHFLNKKIAKGPHKQLYQHNQSHHSLYNHRHHYLFRLSRWTRCPHKHW